VGDVNERQLIDVLDGADGVYHLKAGRGFDATKCWIEQARIVDRRDEAFPDVEKNEVGPPWRRMQWSSHKIRDACFGAQVTKQPPA
jgi:hypothetical protein